MYIKSIYIVVFIEIYFTWIFAGELFYPLHIHFYDIDSFGRGNKKVIFILSGKAEVCCPRFININVGYLPSRRIVDGYTFAC